MPDFNYDWKNYGRGETFYACTLMFRIAQHICIITN